MYQNGRLLNNIDELLSTVEEYENVFKIEMCNDGKSRKRVAYVNLPFSFDIETTSFYSDTFGRTYTNEEVAEIVDKIEDKTATEDERNLLFSLDKRNIMYIWQIALNGNCIIGRTWQEFDETIAKIVKHFDLYENHRLICFVHNLSYEMQYIRKRFEWLNIFAREKRKPLKGLTTTGIEFRCSYMLSGLSLEKTCENLTKYKIEKKVGDLDYRKIRTPLTSLTETELGYCINDVIGLNAYIQEQIEMYGDITKIPLTNTGRVRLKCRDYCFSDRNARNYRKLMKSLKISGREEYSSLKRAFQGGFTHASVLKAGKVFYNVKSWDFTSSYPTVLVSELYPMSSGVHYDTMTVQELNERKKTQCLVFDIKFKWIEEKVTYEHPLSVSKCWFCKYPVEDNGRVVSAEEINTTITNVDWDIYNEMYRWEECEITNVWVYETSYLPTPFVEAILDLYYDKTTLKDVEDKVAEYMNKKGMLNSCYGMTVTDIITEIVEYLDNMWNSEAGDADIQLTKYNNSSKRFLFYPWGIFCTAYARRNLFFGINEFKDDYIYADTDSVKVLNYENHMDFINRYNEWIMDRLTKACEHHKIDIEKIAPKTIDIKDENGNIIKEGEVKPLGVWDDDGFYLRFKTLGAKRYLVEYYDKKKGKNQLKCTIAGVNKKKTSQWFMDDYDNAFDTFDNFMKVPRTHSGRLISSYEDNETEGYVDDYNGVRYHYHELAHIHMENSNYNLTMSPIYLTLLNGREEQATWD